MEDRTIIDKGKNAPYVVVIDRVHGIMFRVRKPRVGLMRFGREPEYRK